MNRTDTYKRLVEKLTKGDISINDVRHALSLTPVVGGDEKFVFKGGYAIPKDAQEEYKLLLGILDRPSLLDGVQKINVSGVELDFEGTSVEKQYWYSFGKNTNHQFMLTAQRSNYPVPTVRFGASYVGEYKYKQIFPPKSFNTEQQALDYVGNIAAYIINEEGLHWI